MLDCSNVSIVIVSFRSEEALSNLLPSIPLECEIIIVNNDSPLPEKIKEIRAQSTLPLAVGFGIKDAEVAQAVGRISDAVVIGSALVEKIAKYSGNTEEMIEEISSFIISLRKALDNI